MSNENPGRPVSKTRGPAASRAQAPAAAKPAASVMKSKTSEPAPPEVRSGIATKAAAPAKAPKPADAAKHPGDGRVAKKSPKLRPQLVRDSFTMPEADFAVIATLKSRALRARRAAKKSELLRAGLRALAALEPKALVAALDKLEPVKTGRPKSGL